MVIVRLEDNNFQIHSVPCVPCDSKNFPLLRNVFKGQLRVRSAKLQARLWGMVSKCLEPVRSRSICRLRPIGANGSGKVVAKWLGVWTTQRVNLFETPSPSIANPVLSRDGSDPLIRVKSGPNQSGTSTKNPYILMLTCHSGDTYRSEHRRVNSARSSRPIITQLIIGNSAPVVCGLFHLASQGQRENISKCLKLDCDLFQLDRQLEVFFKRDDEGGLW